MSKSKISHPSTRGQAVSKHDINMRNLWTDAVNKTEELKETMLKSIKKESQSPKHPKSKKTPPPMPKSVPIVEYCTMCSNNPIDNTLLQKWCKICHTHVTKEVAIKRKSKHSKSSQILKSVLFEHSKICSECNTLPVSGELEFCDGCLEQWNRTRLAVNGIFFTHDGVYFISGGITYFKDKKTESVIKKPLVFPVKAPIKIELHRIDETEGITDMMDDFEL